MVRKRGVGKRRPIHETKLAIVFYLADGPKKRQDILEYLREQLNVRDHKTIDHEHLDKMVEMGILVKKEKGIGLPVEYQLAGGYEGLQKVFQFVHQNNKDRDFMNTQYFKTQIQSKEFLFQLAKELTHLVRQMDSIVFFLRGGYQLEEIKHEIPTWLIDDKKKEDLLLIIDELESNKQIRMILEEKVQLTKNSKFNQLYTRLRQHYHDPNVKKIVEVINDCLSDYGIEILQTVYHIIKKPNGTEEPVPLPEKQFGINGYIVRQYSPIHLIPPKERDEIIKILMTSPSALSFILKLSSSFIKEKILMLIPYLDYRYKIEKLVAKALEPTDPLKLQPSDCKELIENILIKELKFQSPLLHILKAHLIFDVFNGRVVRSDWFWDFYLQLFPKEGD